MVLRNRINSNNKQEHWCNTQERISTNSQQLFFNQHTILTVASILGSNARACAQLFNHTGMELIAPLHVQWAYMIGVHEWNSIKQRQLSEIQYGRVISCQRFRSRLVSLITAKQFDKLIKVSSQRRVWNGVRSALEVGNVLCAGKVKIHSPSKRLHVIYQSRRTFLFFFFLSLSLSQNIPGLYLIEVAWTES